eukprot:770383-Prymnesium_polylepis.1
MRGAREQSFTTCRTAALSRAWPAVPVKSCSVCAASPSRRTQATRCWCYVGARKRPRRPAPS